MITARLKTFAQNARTILLEGVQNSLLYWGFDLNGSTLEKPEGIPGGCIFRGEVYNDPNLMRKWYNLSHYIHRHTTKDAIEQASYTWFNRLMAISILEHNSLSKPILTVSGGQFDPPLLADAKQGKMSFLSPNDQEKVKTLILEHNDEKAFGILLVGYCRSNTLLKRVFGSIDDFTELLLPSNLLSPGGIMHLINNSGSVSDDEYKEVELIGWLYQFYISDKKDEVFANFKKNIKARSEDIPAATQIFTPRWIVSYMVENTVGKIWLDHSLESPLRGHMKYLVENNNQDSKDLISSAKDLKLLDPAAGSGHILVVGFDLFMQIYREEGYTTKTAVREIIKNNLFGIDIDLRATQLARFAVLLKAALYDADILSEDILPQIFAMPEADDFDRAEILTFLGKTGEKFFTELSDSLVLLKQGKNIGSALKFSISSETRLFLFKRFEELIDNQSRYDIQFLSLFFRIKPFIEVLLILTHTYEAVAANPPYMGHKSMNGELKEYLNSNYPFSKSDLYAVFMDVCINLLTKGGLFGMINQQSWMFLTSYEALRKNLLDNMHIINMLHLGPRTFDEISGEVVQNTAFIIEKKKIENAYGSYYRLGDYRNSEEKHQNFLLRNNEFVNIPQSNFSKITGSPFAYWVSASVLKIIQNFPQLGTICEPRAGLQTSDNARFLRFWFEVNIKKIGFNLERNVALSSKYKWFPHNKGGETRSWFGNNYIIINFENDGEELKQWLVNNPSDPTTTHWSRNLRNYSLYFKEGLTWSSVSSNSIKSRYTPKGFLFDTSGPMLFTDAIYSMLGFLNSSVFKNLVEIFSQTMSTGSGDFSKVPYQAINDEKIDRIVMQNIQIAKFDWDSNETSWDFEKHSILFHDDKNLSTCYNAWHNLISEKFYNLHHNESEINRIFNELYGLQNELSAEVELKQLTILQDELDQTTLERIHPPYEGKLLPVKKDVVIKKTISYLVGCMMGRYRLDEPGLNIAHPNPSSEETDPYHYNDHTIEIDHDAIIPVLGGESPFSDDLNQKIRHLIEVIWGEHTLTENINFIEEALGMPLDKYLTQKFWDFHLKMYKKTPIYWLFESPKGYFKVLTYMHRMDKFTVQKIRLNYLHRYMEHLSSEINRLRQNGNNLRKLDTLEDALQDCRTYSDILKPLADKQITFDLDDGVKYNYKLFEGAVKPI